MNRIAFTLPDVGLRELKGMAFMEDGYLVLRIEDAFLGLADRQVNVIKIEPTALQEVWIRRGFVRDRLVLRPRSATLLDTVPGDHAATLELRVKRQHRDVLTDLLREYEHARASSRPHDRADRE
jgi:hypothetical protein